MQKGPLQEALQSVGATADLIDQNIGEGDARSKVRLRIVVVVVVVVVVVIGCSSPASLDPPQDHK